MKRNPHTIYFISRLLALCLLASSAVQAENFERGQDLYNQHCQSCHEDLMHESSRKLKSLTELRKRIQAWAIHSGNHWTEEDILDVLHYLNKSFYHFESRAL